MGVHRKFETPEELEKLWEEYKKQCDNQSVIKHEFSGSQAKFVSKKLTRRISYTIEGFCVFLKISRNAFYSTYIEANGELFAGVITRIREECEVDVRSKFETGDIPPQLSTLWMSKFGYGVNNNVKVEATELVNDWIRGVMENGSNS